MYLTTFDPISRDFDRIVRRAFGNSAYGAGHAPVLPMDTIRGDSELVLRFDVPGVAPEKIDVTVERGVLTVSATREEDRAEGMDLIARERMSGTFTRRVRLPDNLDTDGVTASSRDGVLEIRIPVREAAKPRKITIGTDAVPLASPAGEQAN